MDSLPSEFVQTHVALVVVVGLLEAPAAAAAAHSDAAEDSPAHRREQQDRLAHGARSELLAGLRGVGGERPGRSAVRLVAAERSYAVPPRRQLPKTPGQASSSPLSPLNPSSPLHPDGIMTPLWPLRHREAAPAVLLAVHDLWESSDAPPARRADPLGGSMQVSNLERDRDQLLASEIADRRKNAHDNGVKFAVIIILKTLRPDSPVVEERLGYIRRSAGIDRNCQFTYCASADPASPSPDAVAFIEAIQKNLADMATVYYREHEKRIKKKRAKLSAIPHRQSPSIAQSIGSSGGGAAATGVPPLLQSSSSSSLNTSLVPTATSAAAVPVIPAKQLSLQAWNIRYDFKLGVFAEFRRDFDLAIKLYNNAYTSIVNIMQRSIESVGSALAPGGGTAAVDGAAAAEIVPGSPRWTEARVFADALSVKIIKLLLFTGQPISALTQLHKHFVHCRELPEFAFVAVSVDGTVDSRPTEVLGLGYLATIAGGGSFEYWAWAALHYRAFGELVEIATSKTKLTLPYPPPGSTASQGQALLNAVSNTGINFIAGEGASTLFSPFSSVNPLFTVQHAGFYYLLAARCTEERWAKLKRTLAIQSLVPQPSFNPSTSRSMSRRVSADMASSVPLAASALQQQPVVDALAIEKNVDHPALIIELLTKSYELFKKNRGNRMTLFLASDIARMHDHSGKHDVALKFFERIGKSYRKDGWFSILASVNRWMMSCARALGMAQVVLELLVELFCDRVTPLEEDRLRVFGELQDALSGKMGIHNLNRVNAQLDMDQIASFIQCSVQFRSPQAHVLETVVYQVTLSTYASLPSTSSTSSLPPLSVSRILIKFCNRDFNLCLLPDRDASVSPTQSRREFGAAPILVLCHDAVRNNEAQAGDDSTSAAWIKHAPIDLLPNTTKTYEGSLTASQNQELSIESVHVVLETPSVRLDLAFKISARAAGMGTSVSTASVSSSSSPSYLSTKRRWLTQELPEHIPRFIDLPGRGELSNIRIEQRKPRVQSQLTCLSPAYMDEFVCVTLKLVSTEDEAMHVFFRVHVSVGNGTDRVLDSACRVVLDASEVEAAGHNDIVSALSQRRRESVQESPASGMVKAFVTASTAKPVTSMASGAADMDFGMLTPGQPLEKTFYVCVSGGRAGTRVITGTLYGFFASSSIQIRSTGDEAATATTLDFSDTRLLSKFVDTPAVVVFEPALDIVMDLHPFATPALETERPGGLLGDPDTLSMDLCRTYEWSLGASVRVQSASRIEVDKVIFNTNRHPNSDIVSDICVQEVVRTGVSTTPMQWEHGHLQHYAFHVTSAVDVLRGSSQVDLGAIAVRWRRLDPSPGAWTWTTVDASVADIPNEILRIYVDIQAHGRVTDTGSAITPTTATTGHPITVRYVIQNTTLYVAELVTFVESSEHFAFSGYKQRYYRVLPLSTRVLVYRFVPLTSGRCMLPQVKTMKRSDAATVTAIAASSSSSNTNSGANATGGLGDRSNSHLSLDALNAIRDKVFPVHAPKVYTYGSKHGELYIFVKPDVCSGGGLCV